MKFYVYAHYNDSGELKYIGKGCKNRAYISDGRSKLWKQTFTNKRPKKIEFLHIDLTEEKAFELEDLEIKNAYKSGINLINLKRENKGGATWLFTDDTRKYFSEIRSGENHYGYGKPKDPEVIRKLNEGKEKWIQENGHPWLGKKRDPELIKKLVIASHTPEATEKRRLKMIGRIVSEETKQKLSNTLTGRKLSEENKLNISKAKKGKPNGLEGRIMPEEQKQKISAPRINNPNVILGMKKSWKTRRENGTAKGYTTKKARSVICLETGEKFRCAKEAAEKMKLSDKHIQACCVGRRPRHGGYTWKYENVSS